MRRLRRELTTPLFRYGFTALTLLAAANGLLWPTIATGTLTALAWKDTKVKRRTAALWALVLLAIAFPHLIAPTADAALTAASLALTNFPLTATIAAGFLLARALQPAPRATA